MADPTDGRYPEHAKMERFKLTGPDGEQTSYPHVISEFVEWLESQGMCIAEGHEDGSIHVVTKRLDVLMCAFMGVNSTKVEEERLAMLRAAREAQEKANG